MAGMAASTSLFRRNINDSDRDLVKFDRTTQDVGRNIDKLSGRLGLLVDVAATLGPALIPTAAAAVPLMAGLTNQLGFAAIAGGTAILAFQGVGDALKAVNEQQLNPSAANLEKMHEAMATLGPAGRDFVRQLQAMRPELQKLQTAAQAGLFPGMAEGIQSLLFRMPEAERIIGEVSGTVGDLLAQAGKSLASPEWDDFFNTLESEAKPTLEDLGHSIGQITKGLADLWIAFTPLNADFSSGFLNASKDFADWADGLSATAGFQEFISYLQTTGPQVAQTLGALSNALLQVLEAASPLGGPALKAIEAFSNAISAIANSDLGTPIFAAIAAWRAYAIAVSIAEKAQSRFNMSPAFGGGNALTKKAGGLFSGYTSSLVGVTSAQERAQTAAGKTSATLTAQRGAFLKGAAGAALLGAAVTGVADNMGATNTAMLGLTGLLLGDGVGAALGVTAGAVIDLAHANDDLNASLAKLNAMAGQVSFATFNKQLADAQKKVDDLNKVSGVGDALSDTAKNIGGALKDPFSTSLSRRGDAQKQIDDAQRTQQNAAAWRALATQVRAGATATDLAVHGFRLTAAGAREAAFSVDQFTFSIRGANAALQRQGTMDAYKASLLDFRDALKENGKTLDNNTRKGLANRAALRSMAGSALEYAGNMKNAAHRTEFLQSARKDFINAAVAAGKTRAAAKVLANQYGLIDRIHAKPTIQEKGAEQSRARIAKMRAEIDRLKNKSVHMDEHGSDIARGKIAALRDAINSLRDRTVTITERRRFSGNSGIGSAGQVKGARGLLHYAYGDVANRHQAELAGPGQTRIWREPETMGEAYIPLADDDRRPRARAIAAETVSLLGGTAYFAGGGVNRRHPNRHNDHGHNDANSGVRHHLHELELALHRSTAAIDKERSARDDLRSKRADLSSTVSGNFLSDPFAGGNIWQAGGGNPTAILKADIAKANAFKATLAQLKKKGLDGQALAAIASTGDIGKAQALLSGGKAGIGDFESAYNQRAKAAASVGSHAGNAVYGAAIARDNRHLAHLNAQMKHLNQQIAHLRKEAGHHAHTAGKETAKGVNKAATAAKHHKRRHGK